MTALTSRAMPPAASSRMNSTTVERTRVVAGAHQTGAAPRSGLRLPWFTMGCCVLAPVRVRAADRSHPDRSPRHAAASVATGMLAVS